MAENPRYSTSSLKQWLILTFVVFCAALSSGGDLFAARRGYRRNVVSPQSTNRAANPSLAGIDKESNISRLLTLLNSQHGATRAQAARRLGELKPRGEQVGPALAKRLVVEQDREVIFALLSTMETLLPTSSGVFPAVVKQLKSDDAVLRSSACDTLEAFGKAARPVVDELLQAARDPEPLVQKSALDALAAVEPTEDELRVLMEAPTLTSESLAAAWLRLFVPYPVLAMEMLEQHPQLLKQLDDRMAPAEYYVMEILKQEEPNYAPLQSYLRSHPDLPATVMVKLGDPKYIPLLNERLKRADSYHKSWLEACLRALGDSPTRTVQASSKVQPADVMSEVRRARLRIRIEGNRVFSGVGHGITRELFTGTLLTSDGKPAVNPHFHYVTVLGKESEADRDVNYDPKTGRFYFFSYARATYSIGPYPHAVEETKVVIRAAGTKPLRLTFYDEQPHTEITLDLASP